MQLTHAALNQIATNLRTYAHLPDQSHRREETARYIGTIFGLINQDNQTDSVRQLQSCARMIVEVTVQMLAISRLLNTNATSPLLTDAKETRFWNSLEARKDYLAERRAAAEAELNKLLEAFSAAQEVR